MNQGKSRCRNCLIEQLPTQICLLVGLCYKILRFEHLIDEPKCGWKSELHDTELDIASDIQGSDVLQDKRTTIKKLNISPRTTTYGLSKRNKNGSSTIEESKRWNRLSRIERVVFDKFPSFLRRIIKMHYTPSQMYSQIAKILAILQKLSKEA
ncbi:unnamed protein product [Mytilus edulis]|uniref:Uncharacterized protein n=1 Tax=Mytilus edulis TaxID=6550 RepID=A0A8S3R073_MYTED|nr:unnamed protein product [Mytilus edulis]